MLAFKSNVNLLILDSKEISLKLIGRIMSKLKIFLASINKLIWKL
ncbi:hypothetical protein A1C_02900 [Rickettsia akari str. Hartford]|uniref:Uncharacterized protein n=1 Tax=Rickettsia akari (strain Hartford) TaxID=293614 RepID=A8GN95_RICAH|nr:hypothetical protein A1C_02900 [Rickettsia akari str. Hartford]